MFIVHHVRRDGLGRLADFFFSDEKLADVRVLVPLDNRRLINIHTWIGVRLQATRSYTAHPTIMCLNERVKSDECLVNQAVAVAYLWSSELCIAPVDDCGSCRKKNIVDIDNAVQCSNTLRIGTEYVYYNEMLIVFNSNRL